MYTHIFILYYLCVWGFHLGGAKYAVEASTRLAKPTTSWRPTDPWWTAASFGHPGEDC